MVILGKLRVINPYEVYFNRYKENYFIDLSPLEKLSNLKMLNIQYTALKELKPLAKIKNLEDIYIFIGQFDEYELSKDEETAFYNMKKFNPNTENTLRPKIHSIIPGGLIGYPIQVAKIKIKNEVDKAMQ
jgi:hypothetical protein